MTASTSAPLRWALSSAGAAVARAIARSMGQARARWGHRTGHRTGLAHLARCASGLYLASLLLLVMAAFASPDAPTPDIVSASAARLPASPLGGPLGGPLAALHLAFLLATGSAVALLSLAQQGASAQRETNRAVNGLARSDVSEFMAQMSHELRTPLNAVIGFSEVMRRELLGPLGHARYQEYARHISESGGRLLKTSEDALAVTETITGLLADRMARGSESISVAELVREAWRDAAPRDGEAHLLVHAAPRSAIVCERRATGQAMNYLLREACLRAPQGATIEVRTTPSRIEIDAPAAHSTAPASPAIMLARILLETQGATLSCGWTQDAWSWRIDFEQRA